jgi:hypothetical protein
MPPQIAARFTQAERAVLAVVAAETARHGDCRLSIGHIAALAGVCASTVRNALTAARLFGLISVEERKISAFRNLPNVIKIVSPEWKVWLRRGGGCKFLQPTTTVFSNSEEKRPRSGFKRPLKPLKTGTG